MVVNILQVKVVEDRRLLEEACELLSVVVEGPGDEIIADLWSGNWSLLLELLIWIKNIEKYS